MVQQFVTRPDDYERWAEWDALDIPVLCLRGETSDLLLRDTTEQMRKRGPRAVVVEIAGCGHAPALEHAGTVRAHRALPCRSRRRVDDRSRQLSLCATSMRRRVPACVS